jgi:hypothetical protein
MALRIPRQNIKVIRKGAPVWPDIGVPFNFTDDEIAQIEESSPDALENVKIREAQNILKAAKAAGMSVAHAIGDPKPQSSVESGEGDGQNADHGESGDTIGGEGEQHDVGDDGKPKPRRRKSSDNKDDLNDL